MIIKFKIGYINWPKFEYVIMNIHLPIKISKATKLKINIFHQII